MSQSAKSQQPSGSTTRSTPASTPSKGARPIYASPTSTSRSKSNLPLPKVLPFPDIPVRPISREGSPLPSPGMQRLNSDQGRADSSIPMVVTGSSDSAEGSSSRTPTSPPVSSPLSHVQPSRLPIASPSRTRAQTSPATRPISIPPPFNSTSSTDLGRGTPDPPRLGGILAVSPTRPNDVPSPPLIRSALPPEQPASTPAKKLSRNPVPLPHSIRLSPPTSSQSFSNHMYQSLLRGHCADIRLVVRKWNVAWHVHKVVLIQAAFFRSLFMGGFSEAGLVSIVSDRKGKGKATSDHDWKGEDIELTFDDPNITRAAFEICLSRLYSPFPYLELPTSLIPTSSAPLTINFPSRSEPAFPDYSSIHTSTPLDVQLATPRLLLSLLATTNYLGLASLLRESLSLILSTIGPATICQYLNFALGEGIGAEEWDGQYVESAKGFEHVAKPYTTRIGSPNGQSAILSDEEHKCGESVASEPLPTGTSSSASTIRSRGYQGDRSHEMDVPASHYYGLISDKIGEACACWLARWGVDVFDIEMSLEPDHIPKIWAQGGLPVKFVKAVLSSDALFVKDEMQRYQMARRIIDLRRQSWDVDTDSKGDISTIHTQDESAYDIWEEEDAELSGVFAEGIRYSHMSFADLATIAADVDPTTGLPFAPLSVLQAAHWSAADLRAKITLPGRPNSDDEEELGLVQKTSILLASHMRKRRSLPRGRVSSVSTNASISSISQVDTTLSQVYHPIPVDETLRVGAIGHIFPNELARMKSMPTIAGLPDIGPEAEGQEAIARQYRPPPQDESTAFGLTNGSRTFGQILEQESIVADGRPDQPEQRWTTTEPFRFSVEFWGVDKLGEKERAYSTTHFYAGSWFNVYVQTIKKKDKGVQLGIYLHRQSVSEGFPDPSSPLPKGNEGKAKNVGFPTPSSPMFRRSGTLEDGISTVAQFSSMPAIQRGLSTPSVSNSPARPSFTTGPAKEATVPVDQGPYTDSRTMTKAYFSISCCSAVGTALLRFSSTPDTFSISQSWGWKSSALRSEEYLSSSGGAERLEDGVLGWVGDAGQAVEAGSLRATVVMGVV